MTTRRIEMLGRIMIALSMLASLTGCPLLLLGAAGAAASGSALVATDRRTLPTQAEDRRIQIQANTRFIRELPDEAHLSTTVFNRRVLLTGEVPHPTEKQKAETITREIANVSGIINELTVQGASSLGARSRDAYLTTRIKAALMASKHLSANTLKVVTERSIVYLMGLVTAEEGRRAADVASRVPGVQKVVTVYEYIEPIQPSAPSAPPPAINVSSPADSIHRTPTPSAVTVNAVPDTSAEPAQPLKQQTPAPISPSSEIRPGNPEQAE